MADTVVVPDELSSCANPNSSTGSKRDITATNTNAEESNELASPNKRSKDGNVTDMVVTNTTEDYAAKQDVVTPNSTSSTPATSPTETADDSVSLTPADPPLDLANTLGFKAGDRLEVQWHIHHSNDDDVDDDEGNEQDEDGDSKQESTTIVWWKATLLEHDGRTTDSVAIRSLLYDALPEMGFPEPSKEDVVFMGHDLLVSPHDETIQLKYKREGLTEEENQVISFGNDEELEEQLNHVVMGALQKNQQAWKALPAAAQAAIAEKMQKMKEKLKHKLQSLGSQGQVITSETIHQLLAQSF